MRNKKQKLNILAHSSILGQKRADISITILVLGVVALCFLTILSFAKKNSDVENSFTGIGLIETMKSIAEENTFYSSSDFDSGDYKNRFIKGNVDILVKSTNEYEGKYKSRDKVLVYVEYKK